MYPAGLEFGKEQGRGIRTIKGMRRLKRVKGRELGDSKVL